MYLCSAKGLAQMQQNGGQILIIFNQETLTC